VTVTLNLPPEIERRFLAEAQAHGMSLDAFVRDILLARAQDDRKQSFSGKREQDKKTLTQLFAESPLKGLDLDFSRSPDMGRPVEL
jgi:plasmid stability protein